MDVTVMTDSIPLDDLGATGDDGLRRDRWGRLLVVPPDGGKPKGYTRYTTVAKALDEGGGLAPWKATATAVGLMLRPGLRAQWEALVAQYDGDPWYAGEAAKKACKRLVEETAKAGGSTNRAEQGTSLHAITGMVDEGRSPKHLTPETERDVEAYVNTLIAAGITIAKSYGNLPAVEVTVVDDLHQVGGTFDRIVHVPGFDLPLVADLKTGADLKYSWQAFAVQIAGYSRADSIYEQGADPNGSTDIRAPMPEVDQQHGLVIWLPAGEARCELHLVDLDAGWEAFTRSLWVRSWRQRRDIAKPLATTDDLVPALDASLAATRDRHPSAQLPDETAAVLKILEPFETTVERIEIARDERGELRSWLQDRINTIGTYSDLSRADLMRSWPQGCPALAASDVHTTWMLAAIESTCDDVEARHSIPFGPSKPGAVTPATTIEHLLHAFPGSTISSKGNNTP